MWFVLWDYYEVYDIISPPGGWLRADRRVLLFNDDTLDNCGFLRYSITMKGQQVKSRSLPGRERQGN